MKYNPEWCHNLTLGGTQTKLRRPWPFLKIYLIKRGDLTAPSLSRQIGTRGTISQLFYKLRLWVSFFCPSSVKGRNEQSLPLRLEQGERSRCSTFSRIMEGTTIVNIVCQPRLLNVVQRQTWGQVQLQVGRIANFPAYSRNSFKSGGKRTRLKQGRFLSQIHCFQIYGSSLQGTPCICPLPALSKPREGSLSPTRSTPLSLSSSPGLSTGTIHFQKSIWKFPVPHRYDVYNKRICLCVCILM